VREHGDELVGHDSPALLDGVALDVFDELGAMRDAADPARDGLREADVVGPKASGRCEAIIIMPRRLPPTSNGTPICERIASASLMPRSSCSSFSRCPVTNVAPVRYTLTTRPPFDSGKTSRPWRRCFADKGWLLEPSATSESRATS
jgi:hypothetical protein